MDQIGTAKEGQKIMSPKMLMRTYKIEGISSYAANIIKQHLLSLGSDAALSRDCLVKKIKTNVIIFGTVSQLQKFIVKIKRQPFGLNEVARQLEALLKDAPAKAVFIARDKKLTFTKPVLCGILNVTPDSFSGDGVLTGRNARQMRELEKDVVKKVSGMVKAGARMIDIGGESTRPYAKSVSVKTERARVIPMLKAIRKKFPKLMISIDSYKYQVVEAAVSEGADVVNDITALRHSPRIAALVKKYRLGCILMHMKGTPRSMQKNPRYADVTKEIKTFLSARIEFCLKAGIKKEQLMVDPGIGFGKRCEDNIEIIRFLQTFRSLDVPLFVGLSRKSFIGDIVGAPVDDRLSGTIAGCLVSIANGADVLRVHDVKEVGQAVKTACALVNA